MIRIEVKTHWGFAPDVSTKEGTVTHSFFRVSDLLREIAKDYTWVPLRGVKAVRKVVPDVL